MPRGRRRLEARKEVGHEHHRHPPHPARRGRTSHADIVDPPTWVRAIALAGLPIGLAGVPIAYFFARRGTSRHRARVGLGIALVGLLAFIALVIALG